MIVYRLIILLVAFCLCNKITHCQRITSSDSLLVIKRFRTSDYGLFIRPEKSLMEKIVFDGRRKILNRVLYGRGEKKHVND